MEAFRTDLLLARTFFGRLFESDLMPPGLPQTQIVIWGIALFCAPGYLLSFLFAMKYDQVSRFSPDRLADAILLDQLLFVTFGMMALGLVALIVWEGVYPDRRDVRILGVLPLRTRTYVVGRVTALAAVAVLFCLSMNLPPAVMYGLSLWAHDAAAGPLRAVAAHLIATATGGLFVFFLVIAAQGILLNVFGRRVAQQLALLMQAIFVVVLLQTMLFVPYLGSLVRVAFHSKEPSIAAWLPPAWFVALYDVLAGTPWSVPMGYAFVAVGATAAVVVIAIALLAGSYRRLVRMALETLDGGTRARAGFLARASDAMARMLTPHPVQRALAGFTLRTVGRSRTHLMLLAMYVGVAAALVLSTLIPLVAKHGMTAFDAPGAALLSVPLVLNFFTLCGMRVLFAIPTDIKANWTFRLHARNDRMVAAISGVRVALLLAVVVPIAFAAGIAGATLWGARTGVLHAMFTGALGMLLVDVLLIRLRKIPFGCTYYPGRSRARTLWPFYGIAFSMYAYSLATLEAAILSRPLFLGGVFVVIAALVAGLALLRRRDLQPPPGLTYEEEDPDSVFGGFSLSEGLAAESPAPVQSAGSLRARTPNPEPRAPSPE